jgi:hypothetical protein
MANVYATKTGNWSDPTVWNTGALPTSADDVFANNFTVTIDQNVTVLSIRSTAQAPAVAGGGFILNGGLTVNANLINGTGTLITYTATGTSTITGTLTIGSGTIIFFNSASGTLNVNGNCNQPGTFLGPAITIGSTGTINIIGTYTAAVRGPVINVNANAIVNITGSLIGTIGTVFANTSLLSINSLSTVTVTGLVETRWNNNTAGIIIAVNATCNLNVIGQVIHNGTGDNPNQRVIWVTPASTTTITGTILANYITPAVLSTTTTSINLFSGPFVCGQYGTYPFQCFRMHLIPSVSTYFEFRDETTNGALSPGAIAPATRMISPSAASDAPAQADVRLGTTYALGTQTGTCNVPNPNSVAFGIPVDNTTGTAVLTVSDVWNYPTSSLSTANSIGLRMKNSSTIDTTGAQLAAFNG